jgi:cell division protein FtsL
MKSLNVLLTVAVLTTGLWVVNTRHSARRNFVALEESGQALRLVEQDNDRLEVEKRAQATPLRVEALAKNKLNMRTATPLVTQYVAAHSTPAPQAKGKP